MQQRGLKVVEDSNEYSDSDNRDSSQSREHRRLQQESQKVATADLCNLRLNPDRHEDVASNSNGPFKRFCL
ncbi:hypothetical protein TIFTF001_018626 [Ficus carica]|uniref:Uncharacterized protein n=1 Tax=Ficus carica TaxID=3494 RepID=A0AA88D9F0_FICCA|nr:hypothetical protein TIFTF001_018626 [Ficus carica]